ncbi:MAG: hypothetical protein EOQ48_14055 [Mesorhizobium sp.]|uniref:hypothetical protein n=1 Tax=Mesorhizobium sp. TaxID=1871066 RepID=UPI000FE6AEC4|nr:MAG: hypothetical protein EOQ48_14055 [Mesorhizobium sp.]
MKVGYTEFSFGYAFTENLIRSSPVAPVGAPVFPNLIQEGVSGFDVRINFPATPLFLQYKLPELMRRGTAFETANWSCPGLDVPFFRISMMRRDISRQHELLINLESRYPRNVFYAAPALENVSAFDLAYNNAAVARRSVFFSPTDIGPLPDHKVHTIAYKSGLPSAYFFSQPKPIRALSFDQLSRTLVATLEEKRFGDLQFSAREMRESVVELASPAMRDASQRIAQLVRARRRPVAPSVVRSPEEESALTDIAVAREIARVDMGIDLMIAQPR